MIISVKFSPAVHNLVDSSHLGWQDNKERSESVMGPKQKERKLRKDASKLKYKQLALRDKT